MHETCNDPTNYNSEGCFYGLFAWSCFIVSLQEWVSVNKEIAI